MTQSDAIKTVLVTGASAGIGKCFAHVFAKNGWDVVLVARRRDKLDELADDIRKTHGQLAHVIALDLSQPDAPQQVYDACAGRKIQIDALVNNAGYGLHGGFLETQWEQHRAFLQVMTTGLVHLTHLFAADMVKRGYGRIINLASIAAWAPQLSGNLYNAAKAFVLDFSQAADLEFKPHGVHCTALCPGFTFSEFHDVMGNRSSVSRLPRFMWMTAEEVAEQGYDAVMQGKAVHVNGLVNQGLGQVMAMLPPRVKEYLSRQQKIM